MRAIFISYRRDDAAGEAGRLFDDLVAKFGPDKVFMDVAVIEPGRDFRKVIDQNVASCGVLLAVIGKGWIDAKDDAGRRRLDDPLDFVRLETASALKRDVVVIPVLVRGGSMPRAEQLPEDLKELAYRNGVELTHARWRSDVEVLITALRAHVGNAEKASGSVDQSTSGSMNQAAVAVRSPFLGRALIGGAVAIVVAAAAVWYQFFSSAPCPNCATVIGVREVAQGRGTTGPGAVVGGLLGGALGDQVSHGRANDAANAASAFAGALAGHQVEKSVRSSKVYEITVHYTDGHEEVIRQSTVPPWRSGDHVQMVNGVLRYAP